MRSFIIAGAYIISVIAAVWASEAAAAPEICVLNGERIACKLYTDCSLILTDKSRNRSWRFAGLPDVTTSGVAASHITGDCRIEVAYKGQNFTLAYEINDAGGYLTIIVNGEAGSNFDELQYPHCTVSGNHLVIPRSEGLLIPPADYELKSLQYNLFGRDYIYDGVGESMPWIGVTDFECGLLLHVLDPYDAQFQIDQTDTGFGVGVVWRSEKGKFGYPRRIRIVLPREGGYVPMAKYYRNYAKETGEWVSLQEKAEKVLKVKTFSKAVDVWLQGELSWVDIIENKVKTDYEEDLMRTFNYFKDTINPASALVSFEFHAVPLFHYPGKREVIDAVQRAGYLGGRYITYYDMVPTTEFDIGYLKSLAPERSFLEGYPEEPYVLADGSLKQGWGFGEVKGSHRCSEKQLEWVRKDFARIAEQADYDAIFYDIAGTMRPLECYSKTHPVTRREDVANREKYLEFYRDKGFLLGTENGVGWCVPYVHYVEGLGTIGRAKIPGVGVDVSPIKTTPKYEVLNLSGKYRIPLFQLVYHDAIFCTFRWEYTPDRYEKAKLWRKQDLITMLYGYTPIFVENFSSLQQRGQMIKQSIAIVLPWREKIGWDELVDHKSLTDDRTVQVSKFSSGYAIIVNFSEDKTIVLSNDEGIAPLSYFIHKWTDRSELHVKP